mgnify:CR=1 FL=1
MRYLRWEARVSKNKLDISSHTVKTLTYNVYKKLGVKNREELLDLVEGEK